MNYEVQLYIKRDGQAAEHLQQKYAGHSVNCGCSFFIDDLKDLPAKKEFLTFELAINDGIDSHVIWVDGSIASQHKIYKSRNGVGIIDHCVVSCEVEPRALRLNNKTIWEQPKAAPIPRY